MRWNQASDIRLYENALLIISEQFNKQAKEKTVIGAF